MSHYSRRIWYHNSLRGRIQHCMSLTDAVLYSETTTDEAKEAARQFYAAAFKLKQELFTRNPDFEKERKANAKSHRTS